MSFLEQVKQAGIVGCGGAGFPTHVKWNAQAEDFIVNAAECEPLLSTDKYLMRHRADDIIAGLMEAANTVGAKNVTIAIKGAYTAEIASLKQAIDKAQAPVHIHEMESFYPAGDEQVVVYEVTGRVVPCGGIPLDVGAVVSNVATLVAAREAMDGMPLTEKYITVSGEVAQPSVIHAPVGTSIAECIDAAGGALIDDYLIIVGGPLMGKEISGQEADLQRVTKTTSGILVLPRGGVMESYKKPLDLQALRSRAAVSCIQCSYCTMLCPRHLLGHPLSPHMIMRAIAYNGDLNDLMENNEFVRNASLCSSCGVCTTYACPMQLAPSKVNDMLKAELAKKGIRRSQKEVTEPLSDREYRKVPTGRLSARVNVNKYSALVKDTIVFAVPKEVVIALRQGPGAPPQPTVSVGDFVHKGDLIAAIPDGALSANLHASVDGKVEEVSDVIRIRREQ